MTLTFRKLTLAAAVIAATAGTAHNARAQTFEYNNTTNFTGYGIAPGGATSTNFFTTMIADDITVGTGFAGASVNRLQFTVYNSAATAVSAQPLLNFYAADGVGGGPGTLLTNIVFGAISFGASSVVTYNYTPSNTNIFTIPSNGKFWAGQLYYSSSATTANLNSLGLGIYNPPTVGSSADQDFITSTNGQQNVSNPTGSIRNNPYGTTTVASYGFSFSSAPEPSAVALSLSGAMLMVGGIVRRRRARA